MLYGLGIDGVVLVYVAHRLALADRLARHGIGSGARPAVGQHAPAGMLTTAATVYGLVFVDFRACSNSGW